MISRMREIFLSPKKAVCAGAASKHLGSNAPPFVLQARPEVRR